MGFWRWLWERLCEPSTWDEEERTDSDRYRPGGMDRQFRGGVKEIGKQFRRAFGENDQDENEED